MSEFSDYKLGDICRIINGRAYKQDELLDNGKYKVLRVGNFFSNNSWYYSDLELDEDKYCIVNDLLFAWSASFGPKIWSGDKTIYHYHIWKLVPYKKIVNKLYLYYYLQYKTKFLLGLTHGSIMLHITKAFMERLPIAVPFLSTQQKIASVLSALDDKIELNNKINAELEAMAKTIYDYWFVQFDFPDANGKPYKSSGGKMVWNEELKREVPERWEVKSLQDFIALDKNGDWGKEGAEGNYSTKVECIRGTDINGINGKGEVKAPVRYILKKNEGKILNTGDLVIEISGGSPVQSTGRLAYITNEVIERFENPLICSNFCKAVSLKTESQFFYFIYSWNKAYDNGIFFGFEGKTSGIKNLLFDTFTSHYHMPEPPKEILTDFQKKVSLFEKQRQKNIRQNQQLSQLRDWLLPMLMNGQVTVGAVNEKMEEVLGMVAEDEPNYKTKRNK